MGKQISFFMTTEDEREFAQFVREDTEAVFIARQTRTSRTLEFSHPEEAERSEHVLHRTHLCIWNKRICKKVTMKRGSPDSFVARGINEELIEFSRCFLHGRTMVMGRLYADMYLLDETRTRLVRKGTKYEKYYDKLARWIRRHYTRDPKYGVNIGPRAREAYENGAIELAEHFTPNGPV